MIAFTNKTIEFFNFLLDLMGSIGDILLAPVKALAALINWVNSIFSFVDAFFDYFRWSVNTLPEPLYSIAHFVFAFVLCGLFIGIIKLIVR